jgi:hypothetical protein
VRDDLKAELDALPGKDRDVTADQSETFKALRRIRIWLSNLTAESRGRSG